MRLTSAPILHNFPSAPTSSGTKGSRHPRRGSRPPPMSRRGVIGKLVGPFGKFAAIVGIATPTGTGALNMTTPAIHDFTSLVVGSVLVTAIVTASAAVVFFIVSTIFVIASTVTFP